MARKTKAEKQIDQQVDAAFYKHGDRVGIPIMDLSKIIAAGKAAAAAGEDIDAAVKAAVAKYRKD